MGSGKAKGELGSALYVSARLGLRISQTLVAKAYRSLIAYCFVFGFLNNRTFAVFLLSNHFQLQ